ncbi:uncharacterized protein LOC143450515 [Clavelina lepadiformis]|uniref:uncharacterized protein LOC143450515 n=1 Tax=Clavelina lepadiformis TaxID=159417 RepID=UPI0040427DF1
MTEVTEEDIISVTTSGEIFRCVVTDVTTISLNQADTNESAEMEGEFQISEAEQQDNAQNNSSFRQMFSSKTRGRLGSACCTIGILGTASGGGLILMYLVGYYTNAFDNLINLEVLSVPGFVLFFFGFFTSVIGILFCWIWPRSRNRRRQSGRDEEETAGFPLPGVSGHCNHSFVPDPPPSYNTIEEISKAVSSSTSASAEAPPAYKDAVNKEWESSIRANKSSAEISVVELPPPVYSSEV